MKVHPKTSEALLPPFEPPPRPWAPGMALVLAAAGRSRAARAMAIMAAISSSSAAGAFQRASHVGPWWVDQ